MHRINSKYFFVFQSSNFKHSIATVEILSEEKRKKIQNLSSVLMFNWYYYPFGLKHQNYNQTKKTLKLKEADNSRYAPQVVASAYNYKYNGKELQDELGLDWYDYGWRDYDPAIGRFNKIDRFAEKYRNLSTYSYAGNNPVLFVDIQGDSIAPGSQKKYDKIKNSVTKTRNKLQGKVDKINAKAQKKGWSAEKTASKIGNLQERFASLDGTLSNFGTLESSTQVYELKSGQTEGGITYDSSSGNIVIGYGNTANFVHEATHAGQFESGGIAFSTTKGASLLQDLGDETAAYKAQFAYSPFSVSGLSGTTKASSFAGITGAWVQGLNDENGNKLYAPGGKANTGITPLNINSTRADLIRAYPNNPKIRNQPANLNLQTQPTIYFKR